MEGSSSSSTLGRLISARPMASICCSPPDMVPASWSLRSCRRGKMVNTLSMSASDVGLVVADVGAHLQVFGDGHAGEHAAAFGHHGQALLDQVPGTLAPDALAQVFDVAIVDRQDAGDGLHGGGLAGAVGADQRDQFAFAHFEIHALDGLDAAVGHLQAVDFQRESVCHVNVLPCPGRPQSLFRSSAHRPACPRQSACRSPAR